MKAIVMTITEFEELRGSMTKTAVARYLGFDRFHVANLISGRRRITERTAAKMRGLKKGRES
jgi:plasmid maintenance system antidote protein VapI